MNMIHRFMGCIREYKKPTILTLLCMVGEVAIEVLIPFFTANLVNEIKGGAELSGVVRVGLGLILMSLVSLGCGALGGLYGSRASAGFAKNVRHDVFTRVQSFAFENIDKFSSASLVTRMTTDINNVQMSFMMCIRIAVRAPLMFLFAVIMAYIMGGALATTFLIIIPVLVIGLLLIARKAMPAFRAVFRKYDKLMNRSRKMCARCAWSRALPAKGMKSRSSPRPRTISPRTSPSPSVWSRSTVR